MNCSTSRGSNHNSCANQMQGSKTSIIDKLGRKMEKNAKKGFHNIHYTYRVGDLA